MEHGPGGKSPAPDLGCAMGRKWRNSEPCSHPAGLTGMEKVGQWPRTAAVFGATGGLGRAFCNLLAERGTKRVYALSRAGEGPSDDRNVPLRFDLSDEASIAEAAQKMRADPPALAIVATGVLTLSDGTGPEKSLRALDGEAMAQSFSTNVIGPALIAKHVLPIMPRQGKTVFAALSARVGSISDNRLGGWHSYRAGKAALNMLLKNFAIETARRNADAIVLGLHPGTVDTALSKPFQGNVPQGKLFTSRQSAGMLLDVLADAEPSQSGSVLDCAGKLVPD